MAPTKRARPLRVERTVNLTETAGVSIVGETVEEALGHYDGKYLDCRDLRHAWTRQGYWSDGGRVKRRLRCERCGTERTDVWSFDGRERYAGGYNYADGYLLEGLADHARPSDVRHEIMERATVYDSEQTMFESLVRRRKR